MFCKNCGNKINPDSKFCMSCGTKVDPVFFDEQKDMVSPFGKEYGGHSIKSFGNVFTINSNNTAIKPKVSKFTKVVLIITGVAMSLIAIGWFFVSLLLQSGDTAYDTFIGIDLIMPDKEFSNYAYSQIVGAFFSILSVAMIFLALGFIRGYRRINVGMDPNKIKKTVLVFVSISIFAIIVTMIVAIWSFVASNALYNSLIDMGYKSTDIAEYASLITYHSVYNMIAQIMYQYIWVIVLLIILLVKLIKELQNSHNNTNMNNEIN